MRARIGKAAAFSVHDWCVLIEAVVTLLVVRVALRLVEFPRLLSWASRVRTSRNGGWSRPQIDRMAWLVEVASRLTWLRCLPRSLALTRVLARRGVASDVRIGVRTKDGKLLAHAWVECMGHALNDDERSLQQFVAFERALGSVLNV
jgi:Transglutaminase-like superfamily